MSSLFGAMIAGGGACAMAVAATSLGGDAREAAGQEQLILWVLLALAAAGALLCLHLALVWTLAAAIQLAGPAGRIGRILLPALRILAPRVARRVSMGAAVASAATGLVLGPALASEPMPGGAEDRPTVLQTSQLLPDEEPEPDPPAEPGTPLPSLGWGDEPAPAAEPTEDDTADDAAGDTAGDEPSGEDTRGADSSEEESPPAAERTENHPSDAEDAASSRDEQDEQDADDAEPQGKGNAEPQGKGDAEPQGKGDGTSDGSARAPRSVVVRPGDTLWSITDDVLGPAPDDPARLAVSWPVLHEANRDVIGDDPDMLRPGQVLTVPAGLDEEAAS